MNQKYIKSLLFVCSLFIGNVLFAQSVDELSDEDIQSFMKQAQDSGMSEDQLAAAAAAKGFTASDIVKFKERMNKLKSDKKSVGAKSSLNRRSVDSTDIAGNKNEMLEQQVDKKEEEKRMKIFGLNIFNNKTLNFEPNLNIATPKNYVLGVDDELSIDISGYAYAHYAAKVSAEGTIKIENLSPIYVNGQTIEQAKEKIIQRLKTIFGGLSKSGALTADVTLSKIRSIKVNVIGEAVFPGTYTLPSLASVFNVLYAAGGPTDIGSLRNIEVFRNGKIYKILDLYDYLLKGDLKDNVVLHDQDIIRIPYVDLTVMLNGQVRNPKVFELKKGENLNTLFSYAGGFAEMAYTKSVKAYRVMATEMKIITVDKNEFNGFYPQKGDVIQVDSVSETFENRVIIEGAIKRKGAFELELNMTLKSLVEKAEGLNDDAYKERILVFRERPNLDSEILALNYDKDAATFAIQKNDSIVIKTYAAIRQKSDIQIDGEINKPGNIKFAENLTVSDAIFLAGGFKYGANPSRIEIARRVKKDGDDSDKNVEIILIEVDPNLGILGKNKRTLVQPFDKIFVRKLSQYEIQKTVSISGEIKYPGPYTLNDKKERISDLIEKSGGLKGEADLGSAKFTRNGVQMGVDITKVISDPTNKQNLLLNQGDILDIPRKKETVSIQGNVFNPITVPYQDDLSLKDYLSLAGGTNDSAHVKKIYVKYGNGRLNRTKTYLGFKKFPKIENGSEIYVPLYKKQRWTSAERIAVSSAVVSIATVLISIVLRVIPNS